MGRKIVVSQLSRPYWLLAARTVTNASRCLSAKFRQASKNCLIGAAERPV